MKIYFSGIGGTGIGPLAEIALDNGYEVTGSDNEHSVATDSLEAKGVEISYNQDGKFLQKYHETKVIDWFVYTAALTDDHPELVLAKKLGIKTSKRDEFLAYVLKEKNLKLIAIAGTHGKTTTTSMLIWTMQKLGVPISYLVGTSMKFGPSGKYDKNSQYFVYECDEFDRNFLNFHPFLSLIPSIDFDHPDTYKDQADYLGAFRAFAKQSQAVIAWYDQHGEIFDDLPNIHLLSPESVSPAVALAGNHNKRNATVVLEALRHLEVSQTAVDIINSFPGVDRRFEKLADNLYTDYGHHPSEITATLQMAREISDHVVLVYQPHQNTRQHELADKYTDQFELAEKIYWLPTYITRENPDLAILSPQDLIKNITNKQNVIVASFDDKLWQNIKNELSNNHLVIIMGAGEIDGWFRDKLNNDKLES